MRNIVMCFFLILFISKSKAQSTITLPETLTYINNILSTNNKDRWSIYKMQSDNYGNVRFFCSMGQYWFNINDSIDINTSNYFVFPSDYNIKSSLSGGHNMAYTINKKNQPENALWLGLYGGLHFININHEDTKRLINAFKYLKTLSKDPFKD